MNGWLQFVASNTLVAALAAVVVMAITRVWRNPHLAHLLWALVLVKLVTPPLWDLPIPVLSAGAAPAPDNAVLDNAVLDNAVPDNVERDELARGAAGAQAATGPEDADKTPDGQAGAGRRTIASADGLGRLRSSQPDAVPPADSVVPPADSALPSADGGMAEAERASSGDARALAGSFASDGRAGDDGPAARVCACLAAAWLAGTVIWLGLLAVSVLRFHRLVRAMPAAPDGWQTQVAALAARIGLSAWPSVRLADGAISPLLWPIGSRPVIVLPRRLIERLDADGHRAVLAHELAHFCRRDHWMRWFEMSVLALYWWNPIAWWARRQLRVAEERCCDAWAIWLLGGNAHGYGLTLLETIDFLADSRAISPVGASGMGTTHDLKGRFEMILAARFGRRPTWRARLATTVFALAFLPFSIIAVRAGAQGEAEKSAEAVKAEIEKAAEALTATIPASKRPPAGWLQTSPFTTVHVKDDAADVKFEGKAYQLISIDGLSTKELLDGAAQHFGQNLREKRFVEDLVAVMEQMEHKPGDTVKLVLRDPASGETKTVDRAPMTAENRRQIYFERNKIGISLAGMLQTWARLSPFTAVRPHGDAADVEFDGKAYQLVSIDDLPTKELLDGARNHYGDLWEKRFVEDLVEVMDRMGHRPGNTVKLVLRDPASGETKTVDHAPMTLENRAQAYAARYAFANDDDKQVRQLVDSFAAATQKTDLDALAKTLRPRATGEGRDLKYFSGLTKELAGGAHIEVIRTITPLPQNHALAVTDFFPVKESAGKAAGQPAPKCLVYHCVRQEGRWLIDKIDVVDLASLLAVLRDAPREARAGAVD